MGGAKGFFSDDTKYQVMANTWLYSVDTAMKDWTFAWMLDDNSPVVKIFDALKYKQALLLKTALVGKAVGCLASLAIMTFDNVTDILLAIEYFRRRNVGGQLRSHFQYFRMFSSRCLPLLMIILS